MRAAEPLPRVEPRVAEQRRPIPIPSRPVTRAATVGVGMVPSSASARATPPLGPGDIATTVAASPEVQRERAELRLYLDGTYRDPGLARARLEDLVASHGPTSAARAEAARVGQVIAPAVARIGAAEANAALALRAQDAVARAAAQTGTPRLSQGAEAAIGPLGAADGPAGGAASRAEAWAALRAAARLAGEFERFLAAVAGRFGAEGLRAFERGSLPAGATGARAALAEVGRGVTALRRAERAGVAEGRRFAASQPAGQGTRPKP